MGNPLKYELPEVTDLLAEQLIPGHHDIVQKHLERVHMTKAQYLEQMAAAFMVQTGTPAAECVLVEEPLPWPQVGTRFYYKRRA